MAEEPEDCREFVRSLMAKSDAVLREVLDRSDRRFEAAMAKWEVQAERTSQILERLEAHAEEQRAEHKAMIAGLMNMLDRLPPPDAGPAAA
jgi:hypothetical protein